MALAKGQLYLERNIYDATIAYEKAIVAYALTLLQSPAAKILFQELKKLAKHEGLYMPYYY